MSRDRFQQPPLPTVWDTIPVDAAEGRPARECFADEVAIDFPSVDHMVERVRDGFLTEIDRPEMLTTEVTLSVREARRGTILPLEVPVRALCVACGGRGETWTEPCVTCLGSGESVRHYPVKFAVPPGVSDGARFRFRVRAPHAAPVRVEVRVRTF